MGKGGLNGLPADVGEMVFFATNTDQTGCKCCGVNTPESLAYVMFRFLR